MRAALQQWAQPHLSSHQIKGSWWPHLHPTARSQCSSINNSSTRSNGLECQRQASHWQCTLASKHTQQYTASTNHERCTCNALRSQCVISVLAGTCSNNSLSHWYVTCCCCLCICGLTVLCAQIVQAVARWMHAPRAAHLEVSSDIQRSNAVFRNTPLLEFHQDQVLDHSQPGWHFLLLCMLHRSNADECLSCKVQECSCCCCCCAKCSLLQGGRIDRLPGRRCAAFKVWVKAGSRRQ